MRVIRLCLIIAAGAVVALGVLAGHAGWLSAPQPAQLVAGGGEDDNPWG